MKEIMQLIRKTFKRCMETENSQTLHLYTDQGQYLVMFVRIPPEIEVEASDETRQ